ncbi:MAG: hypothetical protein GXP14_09265 [Gammaproteobacteria bacterium]|nr:hypothetical protein [Gammaproteobacteria bacterium]
MQLALIISYPLLIHLAIWREWPNLQLAALIILAVGLLYKKLIKKNTASWGILVALISVIAVCHYYGASIYLSYLPPVVIFMLFLFVFSSSLRKNQTPIVTDIAEKSRGFLAPEIRNYTRSVTIFWSFFFLVMTIWTMVLPWLVSPTIWSWFTNFVHYVLVAVFFVAEYYYRKWRFRGYKHPGLWSYINLVVKAKVTTRAAKRNAHS